MAGNSVDETDVASVGNSVDESDVTFVGNSGIETDVEFVVSSAVGSLIASDKRILAVFESIHGEYLATFV